MTKLNKTDSELKTFFIRSMSNGKADYKQTAYDCGIPLEHTREAFFRGHDLLYKENPQRIKQMVYDYKG